MYFIYPIEIFIIFILLLIMSIIVGLNYIANNILQIIFGIVVVVIFIVVSVLLFKLFAKLYKRNKNKYFFIGFIAVLLFWLLGPLFFMQFEFLDKCDMFLTVFGDNILLRYLVIPMVIGFLVSIGFLLVAYKVKGKLVQSLLCLMSAIFILSFASFSANICTKSYSDSTVEELANENTTQYVVNKKTKIYYPCFSDQEYTFNGNKYTLEDKKSIFKFPFLCPIKFSPDYFEEGDIVIVKSTNSLYNREYVRATNGTKGGFIETKSLI